MSMLGKLSEKTNGVLHTAPSKCSQCPLRWPNQDGFWHGHFWKNLWSQNWLGFYFGLVWSAFSSYTVKCSRFSKIPAKKKKGRVLFCLQRPEKPMSYKLPKSTKSHPWPTKTQPFPHSPSGQSVMVRIVVSPTETRWPSGLSKGVFLLHV